MKKIHRAKKGKQIAGVCKGIANSVNVDVSYVRLAWILLAILPVVTFPMMVLVYIVLIFVLPEEKDFIDV